ncbi:MAG: hypothetical protein ACXWES_01640 [Solirubrobacterales bacterium]
MRKRKYLMVGALTVAAAAAVPGLASATVSNQTITPNISPSKLAKKSTPTPASLTVNTRADYSSPGTDPAATLVDVDLPSEMQINTKGITTCDASKLAQTTTAQATAACPASVLSTTPGQALLGGVVGNQTGVITPFLGGPNTIILHVRIDALSITQILTGEIVNSPLGGVYGKRLSVTIPAQQVGGGHEILTSFTTVIDKKFTVKKKVKGKKTKVKSGIITSNCKDKVLSFQGTFNFTQFAAVGIPAGPGPTFVPTATVPCTPAKVKKK